MRPPGAPGENNSGKSYLASLLWGLVAMQGNLVPPKGALLDACHAWLGERIEHGKPASTGELDADTMDRFRRLFDAMLEADTGKLVQKIFNNQAVTAKRIGFAGSAEPARTRYEWDGISRIWFNEKGGEFYEMPPGLAQLLSREIVLGKLMDPWAYFDDKYVSRDPIYLPASRTGFLQLYKPAVRAVARDSFRRDARQANLSDLTTPAFHFIDMIAFGLDHKQTSSYAAEAAMLEQALRGRVQLVSGVGVNEIWYHCDGVSTPLSMNLASSLVTELAPIIVVLRHADRIPVLVLEEPESHLHPKLQRLLARVIVRLVNKGVFCWITTHSENFCQQINNFIKMGSLPAEKRLQAQGNLGYDEHDCLHLDHVSGYQFDIDAAGHTQVNELQKTEHGLAMPSFNRELGALGRELDMLNSLLGDDES